MLLAPFAPRILADPSSNLVLHYTFDSNDGSVVLDQSGNGNTGIVHGATWTSGGKLGGGMTFDGLNDYVEADSLIDDINMLTGGTVSAWFKAEGGGDTEKHVFAMTREQTYPPESSIRIVALPEGHNFVDVTARVDGTWLWRAALAEGSIVTGEWYHAVVTHDGTEASFYINGEEPSVNWTTTADKTAWFKAVLTDAGEPADTANLGVRELGSSDVGLHKGHIDEVAVYDRALSSNEVYHLYLHGTPPEGELSGVVTGVLSAAGSPYCVTGNIHVPSNTTLTIEDDVEIAFCGHYYIDVDGTIQANGTSSNGILITASNHVDGWAGVRIENNTNDNCFSCVTFEYGRALGAYASPFHGPNMEGAGVYVKHGRASFDSCVFRYNKSTVHGSAVSANGTINVVAEDCEFLHNETVNDLAGFGALYFASHGQPLAKARVVDCTIAHNTARDEAAGIGFVNGFSNEHVLVANNLVYSNYCHGAWAPGSSGAGRFDGGRIINNVFYGNELAPGAVSPKAVVHLKEDTPGTTTFKNNIIYGNTGQDSGIYDWDSSVIEYNCVEGGHAGTGNITSDPQFVDVAALDFRLMSGSDCIDAGDTTVVADAGLLLDRAGSNRVQGLSVDMGAYEFSDGALSDGLVLHYTFASDDGSVVLDQSGNSHTATVFGATYDIRGKPGGSYDFNGAGDYLQTPDAPDLRITGDVTVAAWIRPESFAINGVSPYGNHNLIIGKNVSTVPSEYDMTICESRILFTRGNNASYDFIQGVTVLESNRWYHVVGVAEGSMARVYIDGQLDGTGTLSVAAAAHSDPIRIGRKGSGGDGLYFDGLIDDVRVYSRALASNDVSQLYMDTKGGPILLYTFDTDDGPLVLDQSGNNNTGTVHGATWTSSGRWNGGMVFDGSNDHVDARSVIDDIGTLTAGTFAVWFRVQEDHNQNTILAMSREGAWCPTLRSGSRLEEVLPRTMLAS